MGFRVHRNLEYECNIWFRDQELHISEGSCRSYNDSTLYCIGTAFSIYFYISIQRNIIFTIFKLFHNINSSLPDMPCTSRPFTVVIFIYYRILVKKGESKRTYYICCLMKVDEYISHVK